MSKKVINTSGISNELGEASVFFRSQPLSSASESDKPKSQQSTTESENHTVPPPSNHEELLQSVSKEVFESASVQTHERTNERLTESTNERLNEGSDAQLNERADARTHERSNEQPSSNLPLTSKRPIHRYSYDLFADQADQIDALALVWRKKQGKHVTKGEVIRTLLDQALIAKK